MQFALFALSALAATASAAVLPRQSSGWTVRNFSRNCNNPDICTYYLTIDQGNGALTNCTIAQDTSPNSAESAEFYGVPCQETTNFEVSWGWDYTNDFTTMTVVQEDAQLEAFFGYDHPNADLPASGGTVSYPDNGPQAVQATGA